jgi:hypothetical protein
VNQIRRISPVSDADAARMVSGDVLADLAEQIMATPVEAAAAHRAARVWRRRWLAAVPAAAGIAAAALIAASAVHPGQETGPSGIGPLKPDAHALAFTRIGGYIDVIVRDPVADEASYNAEFKAHGLDITLSLVPVSPSLVGTVVFVGTSGPDGDSITTITAKGRCWTGGGGNECPVGLKVPVGYHGQADFVFGRAARRGETYESTAPANAPGEAMYGMKYVGVRVARVLAMLRGRGVTVPVFHYDAPSGNGELLPPGKVPGTWYVYDATPWAARQVMLWVGPAPRAGAARPPQPAH